MCYLKLKERVIDNVFKKTSINGSFLHERMKHHFHHNENKFLRNCISFQNKYCQHFIYFSNVIKNTNVGLYLRTGLLASLTIFNKNSGNPSRTPKQRSKNLINVLDTLSLKK